VTDRRRVDEVVLEQFRGERRCPSGGPASTGKIGQLPSISNPITRSTPGRWATGSPDARARHRVSRCAGLRSRRRFPPLSPLGLRPSSLACRRST